MRLKGRWIPEKRVRNVEGAVREIDCGMGMKELKREIDYFMILPEVKKDPPNWKKPAIIGSLWASGVSIGIGLTLSGNGIGLLLLVAGLAWMCVVIAANSTVRREKQWKVSTKPRSGRVNARKRSMRAARSLGTAPTATSRYGARRRSTKATGTAKSMAT